MSKFKVWLIEFLAGDQSVILNCKINGDVYAKRYRALFSGTDFNGRIFDAMKNEIICTPSGEVRYKCAQIRARFENTKEKE